MRFSREEIVAILKNKSWKLIREPDGQAYFQQREKNYMKAMRFNLDDFPETKRLKVGDFVKLKNDIVEGNEDLPPTLLAKTGEILEVVGVGENVISVAHDWAKLENKSFRLHLCEYEFSEVKK